MGPSSSPRTSSGEGRAVSTARRQGRPEGEAGIRNSSGSQLGVHGDVDVAIDHARPVAAAAVEGEGQRAAVGREVGPARLDAVPDDVRGLAARPPRKNVRRRRAGWRCRSAIISRDEAEEVGVPLAPASSRPSSIALSWHQALLLPCWVRRNSSPPRSIGTPCETSSVAIRLRACRRAERRTVGIVGRPLDAAVPAAVVVAAVAVALAVGLVVLLVVARPGRCSVKPSWQVMKLIEWQRARGRA